jgi:rSAM/selenodomain-associated transferase 1
VAHTVNRQLIVFTRFPVPGATKTRLIPTLGAEGAARLQRRMTEHVLGRLSAVSLSPRPTVEIRFDGGDENRMRAWLGEGYCYRPQGEGNLGHRMTVAFQDAFQNGADQVVLIGTDIPGITPDTITDAFGRLDEADVVCGPASDGGYYLIGLQCRGFADAWHLFAGIAWGADTVLEDTLKLAADAGLQTRLLEELTDVDIPQDLPVWEQTQAGGPA